MIADVIATVLAAVEPRSAPRDGGMSKAKYSLDERIADEARARVRNLLDRYPVYPEIDLNVIGRTDF